MKPHYNTLCHLFLSTLLIAFSCNNKIDLLTAAKNRINESTYISYTESALYPIPESDLVDTINTRTEILYNNDDSVGYHFIQMNDRADYIYQENMLRVANHKDSTFRIYLPKHFENSIEFKKEVESKFNGRWSPMALLKEEWEYVADTVIGNFKLKNYYRVENDRVYEGNKILTEQHIFINPNALLEKFERRNYFNGSLSQRVTIDYSNYSMLQEPGDMNYDLPENYVSTYGIEKKLESLKAGELAPDFVGINMAGDSISNNMFEGKKVLLNFSITTCGYCKMALDYINQEDYVLSDDIDVLYINPEDDHSRMESYMQKIAIPFPVIASAEDIAQKYRVYSYPRFFLIDEKGEIEKIQVGYSKEFLDEFRKSVN